MNLLKANPIGSALMQEMGGKYAEWCRQGYIYVARSGAAAAIPVNTTLTNSPTLWNPSNSGKCIIPISVSMSAATLGTQVIDGFTVSFLANTGKDIGSGLPMATFTDLGARPMRLADAGKIAASKAKFANATVTFTTQPAALMDLGMGQWVSGTAATGSPYNNHVFFFDGMLELEPGTSISIGAATAASSGTYWTSIVFAEIPYSEWNGSY